LQLTGRIRQAFRFREPVRLTSSDRGWETRLKQTARSSATARTRYLCQNIYFIDERVVSFPPRQRNNRLYREINQSRSRIQLQRECGDAGPGGDDSIAPARRDRSRLFTIISRSLSSCAIKVESPEWTVKSSRRSPTRVRAFKGDATVSSVASRAAYGHTGKERWSGERGGRGRGPYFRSGKGGRYTLSPLPPRITRGIMPSD